MSSAPLFDYLSDREKELRAIAQQIGAERLEFKGGHFDKELDEKRLTKAIWRIFNLMKDGKWRTVDEIHAELGHPHNSIQANLRNLRKPENGGYTVTARRRGEEMRGLFEFQLIVRQP